MRGGSGFRGGNRGGRGGGRGGSGNGFKRNDWSIPPNSVIAVGTVMNACEEYIVIHNNIADKVPMFNRPIYLENKTKVGVIDDVFGPINDFMFSVKCDNGFKPNTFKEGSKIYMNPEHFLFFNTFIPKPKPDPLLPKQKKPKGQGGQSSGFSRGGFGGNNRGFGSNRGFRGGNSNRGGFRGGSGGYNKQ